MIRNAKNLKIVCSVVNYRLILRLGTSCVTMRRMQLNTLKVKCRKVRSIHRSIADFSEIHARDVSSSIPRERIVPFHLELTLYIVFVPFPIARPTFSPLSLSFSHSHSLVLSLHILTHSVSLSLLPFVNSSLLFLSHMCPVLTNMHRL